MTNISTLLEQTIADIAAGSPMTDVIARGRRIQAHGRIVRSVLEATGRFASGEIDDVATEILDLSIQAGLL